MTPTYSKISKIFSLCEKHDFLTPLIIGSSIAALNYGPLGAFIKHNILQQWNNFLLTNNDLPVFPVSVPSIHQQKEFEDHNETTDKNIHSDDSSLFLSTLSHYSSGLQLFGSRLPFGLLQSGVCMQTKSLHVAELKSFIAMDSRENMNLEINFSDSNIWNPVEWTGLVNVCFCSPKMSLFWFDYWQRQKLIWWKMFSGTPSDFSISDVYHTESGYQEVSIQYHFPWGKTAVEKIQNKGIVPLEKLSQKNGLNYSARDGRKSVVPYVIACESNLDLCVLTYICDAFREKKRLDSVVAIR